MIGEAGVLLMWLGGRRVRRYEQSEMIGRMHARYFSSGDVTFPR